LLQRDGSLSDWQFLAYNFFRQSIEKDFQSKYNPIMNKTNFNFRYLMPTHEIYPKDLKMLM
jgi:hypothetical protein